MLTTLHTPRRLRDILRDARQPGDQIVLDGANDSWLDASGRVTERHQHIVGDVSHLHGAARIAAALRIIRELRA